MVVLNSNHLGKMDPRGYQIPGINLVKKFGRQKTHLTYFLWALFQTGGIFFLLPGKILVGDLTGYSSSRKNMQK